MPQASDEDREDMRKRFGSIDSSGPEEFLKSRGWTIDRSWTWSKPGMTGYGQVPRDEFECMKFLMHEWDYGGLTNDRSC